MGLKDTFERFVVCTECNSIYPMTKCIDRPGVSKLCEHKEFRRSQRCNVVLLKTVELASGKKVLYPNSVYCYNSLKSSLEQLFGQPGFASLCEQWRKRIPVNGLLTDVYDGRVWQDFLVVSGKPFLSCKYSLALCLNIDWFQPYKLTQSSVGVVYLTILNLPRSVRNCHRYTLLVGIIPGPNEPKRDVNSFLKPLVEELSSFWSGEHIQLPSLREPQLVRCALVCVACDLPASKKVAGFLGHTARLGCSKCLKEFPGVFGNTDYSGFDRNNWPPRTNEAHRLAAESTRKCPNKTQRQKLESEVGCRFSVLLDLEYFDPVRMVILDPMHNIFLGSAKYVMKRLWIENGILNPAKLLQMQQFVNSIHVPPDIGRIPRKLETGFSGFTAAQFKNWVNIFSIPALHGNVGDCYLECWRHLVLASRLLCKLSITTTDIQIADLLLLQFCKKIEQLFGNTVITPNMHLHGHLKSVIEDYGPLHCFWLFSFERFNGILGNYPNNNKSIEPQLMKKFLDDTVLQSIHPPQEFSNDLNPYLPSSGRADINLDSALIVFPARYRMMSLTSVEIQSVQCVISRKFKVPLLSVNVHSCFKQYTGLQISGKAYNSRLNRSSHNYVSLAMWDTDVFGAPPSRLPQPVTQDKDEHKRPIEISYFATITYTLDNADSNLSSETFAIASWFSPHPRRYEIGRPVDIWCKSLFEVSGAHSFVPCSLIQSRCACTFTRIEALDECVLVTIPIIE